MAEPKLTGNLCPWLAGVEPEDISKTPLFLGEKTNIYLFETDDYQLAAKYVKSRVSRKQELAVLVKLPQHPNLIPYLGMYKAHFIFEYYPMSLLEYVEINHLGEKMAARLFHQLGHGLHCLHAHGIAHLDVKLENVMIEPEALRVVLIDFGLARQFDPEKQTIYTAPVGGTIDYISPDALAGQGYILPKMDVWAFGVTLYCCLHREHPYEIDRRQIHDSQYRKELLGKMNKRLYRKRGSPSFQDLLFCLLEPQCELRDAMDTVIRHEWFMKRPLSPRHTA